MKDAETWLSKYPLPQYDPINAQHLHDAYNAGAAEQFKTMRCDSCKFRDFDYERDIERCTKFGHDITHFIGCLSHEPKGDRE